MIRVTFEAASKSDLEAQLAEFLEGAPEAAGHSGSQGGTDAPQPVTPATPAKGRRGRPAGTKTPDAAQPDAPSQTAAAPAAAAPAPSPSGAAAPAITHDDVRKKLGELAQAPGKSTKDVIALLGKHGSPNVSGLAADKFAALIADADEMIAAAKAAA